MPVSSDTQARIWEDSRGNPFMIAEMVRAMREGATIKLATQPLFRKGSAKSSSRAFNDLAEPFAQSSSLARWSAANSSSRSIARATQLAVPRVAASIEELVRRRHPDMIDDRFEFSACVDSRSDLRSRCWPR